MIKIILIIPLLIAGSIAIMILSYLIVPMMICAFVFIVAFIIHTIIKVENEEREVKD